MEIKLNELNHKDRLYLKGYFFNRNIKLNKKNFPMKYIDGRVRMMNLCVLTTEQFKMIIDEYSERSKTNHNFKIALKRVLEIKNNIKAINPDFIGGM